jgi:hypothetical protein
MLSGGNIVGANLGSLGKKRFGLIPPAVASGVDSALGKLSGLDHIDVGRASPAKGRTSGQGK